MPTPSLAKELLQLAPRGVRDTVNDVWAIILGDRVTYYRQKNAMRLSKKLHEEAEKLGGKINPEKIPDQFAFEWADAATRKSDETIQDMFVRLLASAGTAKGVADERLIYALKELSSDDAVLFNALYGDQSFRSMPIDRGLVLHRLRSIAGLDTEAAQLTLDNLKRLSLVHVLTGLIAGRLSAQGPQIATQELIRPSPLGLLLHRQVAPDIAGSGHDEA